MFLASTRQPQHAFVDHHSTSLPRHSTSPHVARKQASEATDPALLSSHGISMERSAPEYSQTGLPSPYPSQVGDTRSEASSVDQTSATPYTTAQEVRTSNYPTTATPTSEYGVYPQSARSGSFPEHIQRSYHPAGSGSSGGMAQTPTSPSMPMHDGGNHHNPQQVKSDSDVPIDPSIAAPSPTYGHGQYSPYAAPPQDMAHSYSHPSSAGLYAQPRPDWTGYGQQHGTPITPGHHVFPQTPTSTTSQRPNQVGKTRRVHPQSLLPTTLLVPNLPPLLPLSTALRVSLLSLNEDDRVMWLDGARRCDLWRWFCSSPLQWSLTQDSCPIPRLAKPPRAAGLSPDSTTSPRPFSPVRAHGANVSFRVTDHPPL